MRSASVGCLFCLSLMLALGCDSGASPSIDAPEPEPLVALTAVYAERLPDGSHVQRIVVASFDDPSDYRALSRPDHVSVEPRLSPDRRQVLFGDMTIGGAHAPQIVRYDLGTGRADTLADARPGSARFPFFLAPPSFIVWEPDGSGFYFTNPEDYGSHDIYRHRFADGYYTRFYDARGNAALPIGMRSDGSLLVIADDPKAPGPAPTDGPGYYFMSSEGRYLERIANPHLEYRREGERSVRQVLFPSYSARAGRIAFTLVERLPRAVGGDDGEIPHDFTTKIAVTDLRGRFFETYTAGDFYDASPVWGPGGTILFDRVSYGKRGEWLTHTVMVLDPATGAVREFASPATFGAISLRLPDAGPR